MTNITVKTMEIHLNYKNVSLFSEQSITLGVQVPNVHHMRMHLAKHHEININDIKCNIKTNNEIIILERLLYHKDELFIYNVISNN